MKPTFPKLLRLLALFGLLLLIFPASARADVGPPQPPFGANPLPNGEITNVRMMAETVVMEVDADPYGEALAHVTATFTMRNLGEAEERMKVRFPLNQALGYEMCEQGHIIYQPIGDLAAWVDRRRVSTEKTYQEVWVFPLPPAYGGEERDDDDEDGGVDAPVSVPCWENFPVTFPPVKDVTIKITYTGRPYDLSLQMSVYQYRYVLATGAGWNGTIGSADIVVRMPYEVSNYNYLGCDPDDYTCTPNAVVDGREIRWHYEDFEPSERVDNIAVSVVPPPLWHQVLRERKNTATNPQDGEAWGRLAKAYKEIFIQQRGYRQDPAGLEIYQWSQEAYQKALALLPNDVDWHYGYAELLCHKVLWDNIPYRGTSDVAQWIPCLDQLQQTLALKPGDERVLDWLDDIGYQQEIIGLKLIDLSGPEPVFLYLTPQPSTPTPLSTPTHLPTQTPTPSATLLPLQTASPLPITVTPPSVAQVKTAAPAAQPTATPQPASAPLCAGFIAAPLLAAAGASKTRKKSGKQPN